MDDTTVNLAKKKIQKIMERQKRKEQIIDENIGKLSKQHIITIKHLCEMNEIKVTIETKLNRILVGGHREDVSKTLPEIFSILKKVGEEEKEKETADLHADLAEIVSQGVQWFWVDPTDGEHVDYDKCTNANIEKAYNKKKKSVIFFVVDDEKCEIVFEKMQETNLQTNVEINVIRKDLKADVCVPEYWEPQPVDGNGKELPVHLVALDPNNPTHKAEHKMVSDHFCQTATNVQIQQIERVQNPSLYKLYAIKKQSLDKKQGSNEQFLFHGTWGDKIKEINENGLNRSFAGNINGARFGRGVYFARDAQMSVGYAKPETTTNKRYMYYTRVAVGQYTVGDDKMVVPPPKGGNSNDYYDSVVNIAASPTIFVLFYDNQYYPEYLITFADM